MHAHLIPSYYLERVASTRTVTEGEPLRALAERLRTPMFEPDGALGVLSPVEQDELKAKAQTLAEVFQRSSSNVEGRNGYLSLRNHQLRGLDHPRKRACLTAVHNFLLTRPDGTTAAERFFGQKPRSMFAAILDAVEIPPAPLKSAAASRWVDRKVQGGRRGDQGRRLNNFWGSVKSPLRRRSQCRVPRLGRDFSSGSPTSRSALAHG